MRQSAVTSFTANAQSTPSFTLLSGDGLTIVNNGTGVLTFRLEYMAEGLSGTPWLPVYFPNTATAVTVTAAQAVNVTGLPRGYYRLTVTAWTSGTRDVQLIAY